MYRMVIIDDEKWVVKSLSATLRSQGWFELAGEAYDGLNGLMLLRERRPELAFVDVTMPGMTGLELLRRAGELSLPTMFVMISDHAEFAYAQKALFYNAISYCLKPFSKNELFDSMEKAYRRLEAARPAPVPAPAEREAPPPGEPPPVTANKTVNQMLHFVHQNYRRDISAEDLAVLCAIHKSYAGQLFRQVTGETFSGYLTRIRMDRATALLLETDMPVAAIAAEVGYSDYFYFAKVFKKAVGETPSAYRAKES